MPSREREGRCCCECGAPFVTTSPTRWWCAACKPEPAPRAKPLHTGFVVVNTPGLKRGDTWAGCRYIHPTRQAAEAVAGERLGVSRWVAEVWEHQYPILGGGPRNAEVGHVGTRFIVAC